MLMEKLEAALISEELVKVHRWWVPRWLAVHLRYFQSYIVTHWNDHGRPASDLLIQKGIGKIKLKLKSGLSLTLKQ